MWQSLAPNACPLLIFCGLCFSSKTLCCHSRFLSWPISLLLSLSVGAQKQYIRLPESGVFPTCKSHGQFNTTCSRLNLSFLPFSTPAFSYVPYLTKCQHHLLRSPCQKPQSLLTTLSHILPSLTSAQVFAILTSRYIFMLASPLYSCYYIFHLVSTPLPYLLAGIATITHCFPFFQPRFILLCHSNAQNPSLLPYRLNNVKIPWHERKSILPCFFLTLLKY